jgi:hypothetical protein
MLLNLLLSAISLVGYCLAFKKFLRIGFYFTPWITSSLGVSLVYLFGLFGQLRFGYFVFITIGMVLFATNCAEHIKKTILFWKNSKSEFLLLSTVVIIYSSILYKAVSLVPSNYRFVTWDEFPIWAFNSKILEINQNFWNASDANPYKAYQPGAQLVQYLYTSTFGWTESNVLRGQNVWIFFCLLALCGIIAKKSHIASIFFLVSVPTIYYATGFSFANIMADGLLALQFLTLISFVFAFGYRRQFVPVYVILSIPLILFKSIGIVLISPVIFLLLTTQYRRTTLSEFRQVLKEYKDALLIISVGVFSFVTYISWSIYLSFNGMQTTIVPPKYDWLLDAEYAEFRIDVVRSIIDQFSVRINDYSGIQVLGNVGALNLLTLFLLLFGVELIGRQIFRKNPTFAICFQPIIWILGLLVYVLSLFLAYILVSTERDALQSSSFFRYISVYLFAWIVSLALRIVYMSLASSKQLGYLASVSLMLFSLTWTPAALAMDAEGIKVDKTLLDARKKVESFIEKYEKPSPGKKIYFINQNSTGYEKYIFAYLLPKNEVNYWCWSLGPKFYPEDLWTCDSSLKNALVGYDYLYIYKSGPELVTNSKPLLDMFQIGKDLNQEKLGITNKSGQIELERFAPGRNLAK